MATRQPGITPKYGHSYLHTRVNLRQHLADLSVNRTCVNTVLTLDHTPCPPPPPAGRAYRLQGVACPVPIQR